MAPNAWRLLLLLAVLVAALLGGAYWTVSEPSGGDVSLHRWVPAPRHWRLWVPDGLNSLSGGGGKVSGDGAAGNRSSAAAAGGGGGGGGPRRGGRLTAEVSPSTASSSSSSDPVAAAIAAAVATAEAGTASSAAATSGIKPENASAAAPQPPQRAVEPTAASMAAPKAALSLSPIVPTAPPPPQHQQQQQLLGSSLAPSGQAALNPSNGNATTTPEQSPLPPQPHPLPRPPPLPWCGAAMSPDDVAEYHMVVLASPRTHQGRYLAMTLLSVAASDARPTSLTVFWGTHDPAKKRGSGGSGGNGGDGGGVGGEGIFSLLSDLSMYDNGVAALRGGGGGAAAAPPPRPPFPHLRIRYLPDDVREGDITTAFYQTLRAPDQVAEEAGDPRLRELPLLVLEGDVLLAPRFGDRMSCLLRMMQGLGRKSSGGGGDGGSDGAGVPDFAVSLYDSGMPSLAVPEAMKKYQASAVPLEPDEVTVTDPGVRLE